MYVRALVSVDGLNGRWLRLTRDEIGSILQKSALLLCETRNASECFSKPCYGTQGGRRTERHRS